MVSHTGVNGVHPHWRNVDDERLQAVASAAAAASASSAPPGFLGARPVDAVVDHILHTIAVAGEDAPALGSDFDGAVVPPDGLEDVAALPERPSRSAGARRDARRVLEKILGGNALRVLDAA